MAYVSIHQRFHGFKTQFAAAKTGWEFKTEDVGSHRFFVPPGTRQLTVLAYCRPKAYHGIAFGMALDSEPLPAPWTSASEFPRNHGSVTMGDLAVGTQYNYSPAEGLTLLTHNGSLLSGYWVYLQVYPFGGGYPDIKVNYQFDTAIWTPWYATTAWLPNGDPDLDTVPGPPPDFVAIPDISEAADLIHTVELLLQDTTDAVFLESLYVGILGRESDPGGKQSWLDNMAQGHWKRHHIVAWFLTSDEFWLRYPEGF